MTDTMNSMEPSASLPTNLPAARAAGRFVGSDAEGSIEFIVSVINDQEIRLVGGQFACDVVHREAVGRSQPEVNDLDPPFREERPEPVSQEGGKRPDIPVGISHRGRSAQTEDAERIGRLRDCEVIGRGVRAELYMGEIPVLYVRIHHQVRPPPDLLRGEEREIGPVVGKAKHAFERGKEQEGEENGDGEKAGPGPAGWPAGELFLTMLLQSGRPSSRGLYSANSCFHSEYTCLVRYFKHGNPGNRRSW